MAQTSTYLNFNRTTAAAFEFYRSVFGTEYLRPISRHRDVPIDPSRGGPHPEDLDLVINVQLPILGGRVLMGTDAPESMGFTVKQGNNVIICLRPDTRADADHLYAALSEGGQAGMPLMEMFWGDYFGTLVDKFGINWMINCASTS